MQPKEYVLPCLLRNTTVAHVVVKQLLMTVMPKGNVSFHENVNVSALISKQNKLAKIKTIIGTKHLALAFVFPELNGQLVIQDMLLTQLLKHVLASPFQKQHHLY